MGYEIHITRQEFWVDEDDNKKNSMEEWKQYVAGDIDMRLDNYAEATTTQGETISVVSEGLSVWTKYSGDGIGGNHAWFGYRRGNIDVKNPDDEILHKMLGIAAILQAKVQGDEDEQYYITTNNTIAFKKYMDDSDNAIKKPRWKFW